MTIYDLLQECRNLAKRCQTVLDHSGYSYWQEVDSDLYDPSDPDQRFIVGMMLGMMDDLDHFCATVEYLTREEVQEYTLSLAEDGRPVCYLMDYMIEHEYHCGYTIEYLRPNPNYDSSDPSWDPCPDLWVRSTIEHDGTRYCIVGDRDRELEGLRVRVRQRVPF